MWCLWTLLWTQLTDCSDAAVSHFISAVFHSVHIVLLCIYVYCSLCWKGRIAQIQSRFKTHKNQISAPYSWVLNTLAFGSTESTTKNTTRLFGCVQNHIIKTVCAFLLQVFCSNSTTVTPSSGNYSSLSPIGPVGRPKCFTNGSLCSESTTPSVSSPTSNYPKAPGFEREDQVHMTVFSSPYPMEFLRNCRHDKHCKLSVPTWFVSVGHFTCYHRFSVLDFLCLANWKSLFCSSQWYRQTHLWDSGCGNTGNLVLLQWLLKCNPHELVCQRIYLGLYFTVCTWDCTSDDRSKVVKTRERRPKISKCIILQSFTVTVTGIKLTPKKISVMLFWTF